MNSKFLQLYFNLLLETKQQFSLIDNKNAIISCLDKAILALKNGEIIENIIDDYTYYLYKILYKVLRYKSKNELHEDIIDSKLLFNFFNEVTKNVKSFDDVNSSFTKFLYSKDPYFYAKKTYSKYITPNINYTQNDLLILQDALLNLQKITEDLSIQYDTNLGIKYNIYFQQYFTENDNIKLYCFDEKDISILDQIEQKFLNLLQNKENNRIYTNGIDDGFSFGEQISKKIAKDILQYLIINKTTSIQAFQFLNNNFENLIKKYSNQILQKN